MATPYVDLQDPPFGIAADDASPAVVTQNTAGINLAITTSNGTGANLVLPNGDVFVEEQAPGVAGIRRCIKFGTGVSKLTLSGQGTFATSLVQLSVGVSGELNLLTIDGPRTSSWPTSASGRKGSTTRTGAIRTTGSRSTTTRWAARRSIYEGTNASFRNTGWTGPVLDLTLIGTKIFYW